MRKRFAAICILAVLLAFEAGCEARLATPTQNGAEEKGDKYFYDESSGKVLTDLSDRFDFKIEQWKLHNDEETGQERILLSVAVKNKTKKTLKNFNCDILFDKRIVDFFTTGLTVYDQFAPVDLIPDVTGNGVSYSADLSLNTDEQLLEAGADKEQLLDVVRFVTLKLSWDGGEETVALDCGRLEKDDYNASLLTDKDLIDIELSAPEGSGGIRTLTLNYLNNGEDKTDELDDVASIGNNGYDDDAKEQTLIDSDSNGDGIVDFIVFREFWFPGLSHPEVPLWPTVFEYNLNNGFTIASAKHKEYYKNYAQKLKKMLDTDMNHLSDLGMLAVKRLIFAAERIADGSFIPSSPYTDNRYQDVDDLTKDIKE